MAPPAKRRRRQLAPAAASEDGQQGRAQNTMANYLLSSPSAAPAAGKRTSTPSPSPVKSRGGRPWQQPSAPSSPPLTSSSQAPDPATSKPSPKKAANAGIGTGPADGKGKMTDLKTLFLRQARAAPTTAKGDSKGKRSPVENINDAISEDDDISDLAACSSSFVGQQARKRMRGEAAPVSAETTSASQRFLKPRSALLPAGPPEDDDRLPWSERFGPRNLDELAVHKKKVDDVRRWLQNVTAGRSRQRVLVLKGPAGAGKTTTVRLLAREMGCRLLEWSNPTVSNEAGFVSTSAHFHDFLGRGSRFGTLEVDSPTPSSSPATDDGARSIILVEEFPNTFSRTSSALLAFRNTILQYLEEHAPTSAAFFGTTSNEPPVKPVILVISEALLTTTSAAADSLTAHRLLGPEILHHPGVGVIEFNAMAPSLLYKALELIVQKEARKSGRRTTPGPLVLKRLGEIGDVRNAGASLEFLCLKGDQAADWGARVTFSRRKKAAKQAIGLTKDESQSLELVSHREASLGLFHAVGKVVYNKRDEAPPASADAAVALHPAHDRPRTRPRPSLVAVDSLIDEIGTDSETFVAALHENYILSCNRSSPSDPSSSLDYVNDCIEYLSQSDLLSPSRPHASAARQGFSPQDWSSQLLRQDELAFQLAVRGLLFSLPDPVQRKPTAALKGSDVFRIFYPASLKLWRAKEELEALVSSWSSRLLQGESTAWPSRPLTDGASAFRPRPPPPSSSSPSASSSWLRRQQQDRPPPTQTSGPSVSKPEPLHSLGSVARREMVLDRLPYMAHIARGRKTAVGLRELEKMVSFGSTNWANNNNDDNDDDDDDRDTPAEAWATDRPSEEASPRRRGAGIRAGTVSGLLAQKLVLSDDDIED